MFCHRPAYVQWCCRSVLSTVFKPFIVLPNPRQLYPICFPFPEYSSLYSAQHTMGTQSVLIKLPKWSGWDLFTVFLFLMTCLSSTPAWLPLTGPLMFRWHTPRLEAISIACRVNQPSLCGPPHPAPVSSWLSLRTTKLCLWNWFANSAWITDGADAASSASSPLQRLTPCLPHNLSKDLLKEWMNEENG